jgi:hypothetical protein
MACFSILWLEQLIVWIIIIAAVVAIINLLIPWLTQITGLDILGQALRIILWAVVAIAVVIVIFGLLSCLLGGAGGLGFPRIR